MLAAARAVGARDLERFTHGTTVATNALLERKGAKTAFVATAGFEHLLHLRRQARAHLYRLCDDHPEPLVPLDRCFGVDERVGPGGRPAAARSRVAAGDRCGGGRRLPALLVPRPDARGRPLPTSCASRLPGARVVASHEIAPEFREYERASTTAIDAYLGPSLAGYLEALAARCAEEGLPEPLVMRSSGGVATIAEAAAHPAFALLSGPAAGAVGASLAARAAGVEDAVSLDMGGTSTDVALIRNGEVERGVERSVAGYPGPAAERRHPDRRRRRGLDRVARRGRRSACGPGERGRRPGAGLLRTGRHATDGDRRQPRPGQAAGRACGRAPPRPRGGRAGARRPRSGGRRQGRERRDGTGRSARLGRARARSARARRSWPSAVRGRSTRASSRTSWSCTRCSSRRAPACCPRSASQRATSGATPFARTSSRSTRPASCRPTARRISATRASRSS